MNTRTDQHCRVWFLNIIVIALLFPLQGVNVAAAQGRVSWTIDAQVTIPGHEIVERGAARARAELVEPLVTDIVSRGGSAEIRDLSGGSGEVSYAVKGAMTGTVAEFRQHFHAALRPRLRGLGRDTEIQITSRGAQSRTTDVMLAATPATGYIWTIADDSEFTEAAPPDFVMHTRGAGVSQHQTLHLKNDRSRAGIIKLVYRRPWEPGITTTRVLLDLDDLPSRLDLSDPSAPTTAAAPLARTATTVTAFPAMAAASIPTSLDWRSSGIVTPVRDQGNCGGCWAFGTVGIMESALWKSGTANIDLSEQYLISCNKDSWNCDNGGWTAHKYHYDSLGKSQTSIGAVMESAKPYTATNGTCSTALAHPYKLSAWQFIVATETTMPTVDQIKAAISTYGPITAGVCAGTGWDSYSGGIFTTDETSQCSGGTNHQIILVGWNDNGGTNGYWILRNSWGTSWGINGYMYIAYDKSRVGEGTSWVTTAAVAAPPTVTGVSPSSLAQGAMSQTVTISGSNLSGATLTVSGSGVTFGTATASATQIAVPITVAATAATGTRTVTITTNGGSATATLTVTAAVTAVPTITGISPSSLAQGATSQTVTISGSNLSGATLTVSGSGVTFGTATASATQIAVPITVAATAVIGSRTVTVTTAGGSATATFTVTAAAGAITLFSDGFEGSGWSTKQVSGSAGAWKLTTSGKYPVATPHGGTRLADFNSYTAMNGKTRLYYTSVITLPASAASISLKFWMFHDTGYKTSTDQVQPQISIDGVNWANAGAAVKRYNGSSGWTQTTVDLSAYKGKMVYFGFLGTSGYGNDIYLDDVTVQAQ